MIGGRGGQAYLARPDDVISGQPLSENEEGGTSSKGKRFLCTGRVLLLPRETFMTAMGDKRRGTLALLHVY